MIVSHRLQCIFVKTRKTAGTSIEIALSLHCGPDDVVSSIVAADEAVRASLGGVGRQNDWVPLRRMTWHDWKRVRRGRGRPRFYNHMPAASIRRYVGERLWRRYYKVAVERNPWDRAVSLYYWRTRDAAVRPDFTAFLASLRPEELTNWPLYTLDGEVSVDHVMRFEDLAAEIGDLAARLGVASLDLPRSKGGFRANREPYREWMTDADRGLIARACAREIDRFGYEF